MDQEYIENEFVLITAECEHFKMYYIIDNQCKDTLMVYNHENQYTIIRNFILNHLHLFPVVYGLEIDEYTIMQISQYARYFSLESFFIKAFQASTLYELNILFNDPQAADNLFRYFLIGKIRIMKSNIKNEEEDKKANYDFKEKIVCFTGGFQNYTRQELFTMIYELGGYPSNQLVKDTDFLVIADSSISYKKESTKMILARSLQRNGFRIRIISETQFLKSIRNDMSFIE